MKTTKWIIIIALLCFKTISYSQNFIDETKQWTIFSIANMDTNLKSTHSCIFSGDSIINGSTYNKLYISNDSNQINWTFSGLWFERNDSVFRYCLHCGSYNDTTDLLYDFNIAQGDTFNLYDFQNMVVDSVRLIEWGGSIRKHWFFNKIGPEPYNCLTWIESIGQFGNFNCPSPCLNSMFDQLLCFHENGNLIYQNPNYTDCYVYTNVPTITNSNELIDLFPNPATTKLKFIIPEIETNIAYTLYNLQGVVQLTGNNNKTETELNVSSLQRGWYFLKINTNKETIIKKIIFQ